MLCWKDLGVQATSQHKHAAKLNKLNDSKNSILYNGLVKTYANKLEINNIWKKLEIKTSKAVVGGLAGQAMARPVLGYAIFYF